MPLNTMDITVGSSATVTCEDPEIIYFLEDAQAIANGIHLVVAQDPYATRRQVIAKVRPAVLDPKTGLYNKDKKSLTYVIPEQIDGKTVFHTARVEIEVHPLGANTVMPQLKTAVAALVSDTETANFWHLGAFR